jgi:hypothetical protein
VRLGTRYDFEPGDSNAEELLQNIDREVKIHSQVEEEIEMFPAAKKLMGRDELKELGRRIKQRKQQLGAE